MLFGDDGFGPRVAETLQKACRIPEGVKVMNAGSSVRNILFDIVLAEKKPENIIIVDAIDDGRTHGEIFEISIEDIPEKKIDDFSMHQIPTSNLLKELRDLCNIKVSVIAVQVENIPEIANMMLSRTVSAAIPKACEMVLKKITQISKIA